MPNSIPVNQMTEEEFDRAFMQMMNTPVEEDETVIAHEQHQEEESEVGTETEESENNDSYEEASTDAGSEDEAEDENTEAGDESNAEETEEHQEDESVTETFDFSKIPKDVIIQEDIAVNGVKVRATMNELIDGFKKGMNYTKKMQEIAPMRRSIGIMKDNGLSDEDLNLLVEAKSGNKEALAKLLSDAKIEPYDINTSDADSYKPKDYGKEPINEELEDLKRVINADQEYGDTVKEAIRTMPEDMFMLISSDAKNLDALYKDIKDGTYNEIMPEVIKQQSLYGVSEPTIQTYLKVAMMNKQLK